MRNIMFPGLLIAGFVILASACQSGSNGDTDSRANPFQVYKACKDPRPEVCTQQHEPVCAKRDTGIRCVTTPCPSEENVTITNACVACSDSKVFGYVPGACPQ